MKLAFVSLPVAGHLNPMSALAAKVKSRGHEVVFISVPDAERSAAAAGLRFLAVGAEHFPLGAVAEVEKQLSQRQGEDALRFTFGQMAMVTGAILRPLETLLSDEHVEGVVFDTYQPYLELSAIALGLPYVHIANAAPFDVSGNTPLCFFDWKHVSGPEAKRRNLEGVAIFRELLGPSLLSAKEYAKEKAISVAWDDLSATRSKQAWITQLPEAFDFKDSGAGSLFHTGPFIDASVRLPVPFPWERLTGEPLVYASMGTLQNGIEYIFQHIFDVAKQMSGLQFVVSLGKQLGPSTFGTLPGNVILVQCAPQLEILERAAICITHAGLNTVLESLAHGVPMVALPITNDQPGVAARIEASGTGRFLSVAELSTERLRDLLQAVLGDPAYRENARRIGQAIADVDGLSLAAEIIERVLSHRPAEVAVIA